MSIPSPFRLEFLEDPYESPGEGEEGESYKHEDGVHRTFLSGLSEAKVPVPAWEDRRRSTAICKEFAKKTAAPPH
jgi:hypothetical protein